MGSARRSLLPSRERRFLAGCRIAHLATADAAGAPHVVPVCFALAADTLYVTIDEKPKRPGARLKRLSNLAQNPRAALVADRYDEDWSRLGWVMLRGRAEILHEGKEHDRAQALLRRRYAPLRAMTIGGLPVIALRIAEVASWGALGAGKTGPRPG